MYSTNNFDKKKCLPQMIFSPNYLNNPFNSRVLKAYGSLAMMNYNNS